MSEKAPTPDAGPGDHGDGPERQIVVNDPEDFAKTRQLRGIFDALDDYREAVREADAKLDAGKVSQGVRNKIIFEYMQDVAMAVEPIALSHDSGVKLWKEKRYSFDGTVVHRLGAAGSEDARELVGKLAKKHVTGYPTQAELRRVIGLVGFDLEDSALRKIEQHYAAKAERRANIGTQEVQRLLNADVKKFGRVSMSRVRGELETIASPDPRPSPAPEDVADAIYEAIENASVGKKKKAKFELRKYATDWGWEITGIDSLLDGVPTLVYPDTSKLEFRKTAPPKEVSDEVVRDIRILIQEAGLGIDFDEEQQTKIDDDLLEEVDEWRETNT